MAGCYRIVSATSDLTSPLMDPGLLTVGRGAGCDLALNDASVSRRHAEIECRHGALQVRDLGSRNGTFVNGTRVEHAVVRPGDLVVFGKAAFRILEDPSSEGIEALRSIILERPLAEGAAPLSASLPPAGLVEAKARAAGASGQDQAQLRLAMLLEASKRLSRAIDVEALLDRIVSMVFEIMNVDNVTIELLEPEPPVPLVESASPGDPTGDRDVPRSLSTISRNRPGAAGAAEEGGRRVPRSIVRKVVFERTAILSDDAPEDARFGGASIVLQSVRSAMCVPLIGGENVVLGILYVDNLSATGQFREDDLEFLIAFSSIAAVAIENSRFSERIRRELLVRSNLERFFTPDLAAQIASHPEELRLGGDKKTVAVLFSDIRGFTPLAESMTPPEVAALLTEYLTVMVDVVLGHGGTLDKFIGDCIMAQWGAPIGSARDADRALEAAREMLRELENLNARWREAGRPQLGVGIGLNHGEAFAGYIGSQRRLEYTVIGDPVNVASRLCSSARAGEILLTEAMRAALSSPPDLDAKGDVVLRGKSQTVPVFLVRRTP